MEGLKLDAGAVPSERSLQGAGGEQEAAQEEVAEGAIPLGGSDWEERVAAAKQEWELVKPERSRTSSIIWSLGFWKSTQTDKVTGLFRMSSFLA